MDQRGPVFQRERIDNDAEILRQLISRYRGVNLQFRGE
jgi:hypothetical protein